MFKRIIAAGAVLAGLAGASSSGNAFSLLGQFDANYQTADIGYGVNLIINAQIQDLGGPMNLEEEYRWQSPVLVYGFDTTFLEYFGPEGVKAVENAVAIINALPRVSQMSAKLTEFPLETARYNYTAQQLQVIDMKSLALSMFLEQLGLASPERYAHTLRARIVEADGTIDYNVIARNFDPIPFNTDSDASRWRYNYSPYVNGTLYTYQVRHFRGLQAGVEFYDAQDIALDVSSPRVSVASYVGLQAGLVDPRVYNALYSNPLAPGAGLFFTGITRDDAGGLRYLLSPSRTNTETAPIGAVRGIQVAAPTVISSLSVDSPWRIYVPGGVTLTNATGGVTATNSVPLIDPVQRGGIDKVNLVRLDIDSLLGRFTDPLVIRYPETVWDPATRRFYTQTVERRLARPDILFSAADLGISAVGAFPYVFSRNLTFTDNSTLNTGSAEVAAGPGTINPGAIVFNKLGPWSINVNETPEERGFKGYIFGSFDGSTNAPVVFPEGVDIFELNRKMFGNN